MTNDLQPTVVDRFACAAVLALLVLVALRRAFLTLRQRPYRPRTKVAK
jgi:hypothetical protein